MNKKSSKPIHNRRFCIGCHHKKMVFESQAKADNFIKFNSENIAAFSSKVPTRSYYCSFCAAWHVTSVESCEDGAERDKRDEEIWKRIEFINHAKPNAKRRRNKTKSLLEVELTELYCKISALIAAAMQKLNSLKLEGFNDVLKELSEQIEDYRLKVCAFYSCEFLPDEKHRLRLNTFNEKLELANIVYSNVRKWLWDAEKSKDYIFCCDYTDDNGISAEERYRVNIMKMIDLVTEADRIAQLGMVYECIRLLKQAERLMPETPDHNTTLITNHIEKIKEYLDS